MEQVRLIQHTIHYPQTGDASSHKLEWTRVNIAGTNLGQGLMYKILYKTNCLRFEYQVLILPTMQTFKQSIQI